MTFGDAIAHAFEVVVGIDFGGALLKAAGNFSLPSLDE